MADLSEPIAGFNIAPNRPEIRRHEATTRSKMWWGLGGLTAVLIIAGVIYDMGNRTRTTAPALTTGSVPSSTAVPMGPNTLRSGLR